MKKNNMTYPKITIITCTLNSDKTLEDNLISVKNQSYQNFEHIFIDSNSTDKTINIIKKFYSNPKIISLKELGVYKAFNKGLESVQGDVFGFLNSDDMFNDRDVLKRIAESFQKHNPDYFCSKMAIYNKNFENIFAILGKKPHKQKIKEQFYSSTYFAHPTYYCKKEIIDKVGKFNLNYKVASDIDWLYRLEKNTDNYYFEDSFLIKFRGEGGYSAKKYFIGLKEEFLIRFFNKESKIILIIIYSYHFTRRIIRFIMEKLKLNILINFSRKILLRTSK